MALRKIVTEGYESLYKVCRPVTEFNQRLTTLVEDMKDTLIDSEGVGLAAPQIGVTRRVVVLFDGDSEEIITMINPEIVKTEGELEATEGCLSVPGVWGRTKRPATVTVRAFDAAGREFTLTRDGITAVCFCHEIDHLDGKLFRDHVIEYLES